MKIAIHLSFIGILCMSLIACAGKKKTTSTPPPATTTSTPPVVKPATTTIEPVTPAKAENPVRLGVSFFSQGEGIDHVAKDAFEKFLTGYPKKIAYEPMHWGREGEVDYCLGLTELSAAEQADLVKQAYVILGRSPRVHIKENTVCDHVVWTSPQNATGDGTNRLVVSFYSKGEGIDYKNKDAYEKFLNSYPKKIAFEPTFWGREGEVDYCLKLNELSATEQAEFVRKTKELLGKSLLVHVDENAPCVHKH